MKALTPFIVIAICIGMYFIYISPTVADIQSLSAEKANYDTVLQESKDLTIQRDTLLAKYNNISADDISKLEKVVPDTFDAVLFANDVNALASQHGLTIKDMKFDTANSGGTSGTTGVVSAAPKEKYHTTAVTFALSGQYSQFAGFLADLESSLRLMDVVSISARASGGSVTGSKVAGPNKIDYTLQVNTYSLK